MLVNCRGLNHNRSLALSSNNFRKLNFVQLSIKHIHKRLVRLPHTMMLVTNTKSQPRFSTMWMVKLTDKKQVRFGTTWMVRLVNKKQFVFDTLESSKRMDKISSECSHFSPHICSDYRS
jgi:hypothetical protein